MKDLKIENLVVGIATTNCYLAQNKQSGAMLIIDPGDEAERIIRSVKKTGGHPEEILLTHGHYDHIGAADRIRTEYDIPICALDREEEVLTDPEKNMTLFQGHAYTVNADRFFHDGEQAKLAGFDIQVLHTPGHTIGSACYYLPEEGVLFSGDTLFRCSVGRTDFPTGSASDICQSVRERLLVLPEETEVYPGHDEGTTIRYEKKHNPFI